MDGRFWARLLLAVVLLGGLALLGAGVYQAGFANGLAANIATNGDGGTVFAPYAYGYPGWHGGWGFGGIFGILGFILVLFLIFGLIRAAAGPRGGWGYGRGWGRGPGWGAGPGGRSDWVEGFRGTPFEARARELHDEWHRSTGSESEEPRRPDAPAS